MASMVPVNECQNVCQDKTYARNRLHVELYQVASIVKHNYKVLLTKHMPKIEYVDQRLFCYVNQ